MQSIRQPQTNKLITKSRIHPGMSRRPHWKSLASAVKRNIEAKRMNLIVMAAVGGRLEGFIFLSTRVLSWRASVWSLMTYSSPTEHNNWQISSVLLYTFTLYTLLLLHLSFYCSQLPKLINQRLGYHHTKFSKHLNEKKRTVYTEN